MRNGIAEVAAPQQISIPPTSILPVISVNVSGESHKRAMRVCVSMTANATPTPPVQQNNALHILDRGWVWPATSQRSANTVWIAATTHMMLKTATVVVRSSISLHSALAAGVENFL